MALPVESIVGILASLALVILGAVMMGSVNKVTETNENKDAKKMIYQSATGVVVLGVLSLAVSGFDFYVSFTADEKEPKAPFLSGMYDYVTSGFTAVAGLVVLILSAVIINSAKKLGDATNTDVANVSNSAMGSLAVSIICILGSGFKLFKLYTGTDKSRAGHYSKRSYSPVSPRRRSPVRRSPVRKSPRRYSPSRVGYVF